MRARVPPGTGTAARDVRCAYAVGAAAALVVLAATVTAGALLARSLARAQVGQRDAEALYATTQLEQLNAAEEGGDYRTDEQAGFDAAVRASRLKGVVGIRFFNVDGAFTDSFPPTIMPSSLGVEALDAARALRPHARFIPRAPLSDLFIYLPQFKSGRIGRVPVQELTVPLHRAGAHEPVGAAQFIVEGASVEREYARLDRRLLSISVLTFAVASALLGALLLPALAHARRLGADLATRSARLARANEELALTARVSAVGAVSAHLLHGLKNPLASLTQFVSGRDAPVEGGPDPDEWRDARAAARRMQALIERTLDVLREAQGAPTYDVELDELAEAARRTSAAAAAARGVALATRVPAGCTLGSRDGNLLLLILQNLLDNAVAATPEGGAVTLSADTQQDGRLRILVRDDGPGFPEHLRGKLFLPLPTSRAGGCGLGLAISKQIADYLGAALELLPAPHSGCTWSLTLPAPELGRAAGRVCAAGGSGR